jgi:hypothetical protein
MNQGYVQSRGDFFAIFFAHVKAGNDYFNKIPHNESKSVKIFVLVLVLVLVIVIVVESLRFQKPKKMWLFAHSNNCGKLPEYMF